ncbi:hypothetical protein GOODEAATRI_006540, partial [Goodea atripinnis]
DDSKQAQFLALAVVYFISVLMVSKYRDILEPQREIGRSTSLSGRSIRHEINSPTSTAGLPHTDSGIGEEGHVAGSLNGSEVGLGGLGLGLESLLDSPHDPRSTPNLSQAPPSSISSISQTNKGINVKEILKSLVAAPIDGTELGQESGPTPYHPDPALKTHPMLPMQFHSFDRSVVVPVKKPPPGSLSVNTVGTPTTSGSATPGSTPNIFAAATATPKSMINTTGLVCMKSSTSVVELVMLLCSQSNCAQYAADRREEEKMCDHLISAAKHRDHVTANQLKQKILNILTNKHGAWGTMSQRGDIVLFLLEYSTEEEEEEGGLKSKKNFRSQSVVTQNPEAELMLEGDDDAVSLLQEKEIDNLAASVMFNFPDQATVKRVVYSLPRVGVGTSYGLPQARRISLATPRQLFKSSNMTQRWQRREISNFEYLMFLNTIAGRTYNDLNQYPIFPWVLTNYDSEELDLTLPGNFRDLSKPIGALNPKRAAFYAERYETWDDDGTPSHHYTTLYSTAHSTLMWMVRIPFTTFFLNANDGKFDHPERAFSGIGHAWRNCQRNTADVKALESEFVSCQLHQWIDLIFGYKQRGPEAVRALNVFNFLSYEGAVNLDNVDAAQREVIEAQIQASGQVPSQLLIEPHPPRSSAMHLMQQDVIMVLKFPSNSPVTHVAANTLPHLSIPAAVTVTCSRLFAVNRWHNTVGLRGAPGYSLEQAHHLPIEMDPLIAYDQRTDTDYSVSLSAGKLTQIVFGHWDVVTCLARSESYIGGDCYIVSGSRDATLLLWYWSGRHHIIGDNPNNKGPCLVHTITGDLLRALEGPELCMRPRLISVSSEGHCIIYYERGRFCNFSINGKLLAQMEVNDSSRAILLSSDGQNLVTGGDNGVVEVWQACDFKQLYIYPGCDAGIRAMDLSHDQRTLITGMASGSIVAFNIDFNRWHYEHQNRY